MFVVEFLNNDFIYLIRLKAEGALSLTKVPRPNEKLFLLFHVY